MLFFARSAVANDSEDNPDKPEGLDLETFKDFEDLSLEALLDSTEVNFVTKGKSQNVLDTPGIITIITREEILRSGARDLADLLMQVPGFDIGNDTYSALYAGFRGLWGADGRVLILFDGHETQEFLYQGNVLGNRFPLDQIQRIEIIRGPGSASYVGVAEIAVINIVTRSASQINGLSLSGSYGQMLDGLIHRDQSLDDTYGQRDISINYGQTFSSLQDLSLRLGFFVGQGNRSDRVYTDVYGNSFDMSGNAHVDPMLLNLAVDYQGLSLRYMFEYFRTTMRDAYDEVTAIALPADFITSSLSLGYQWRIRDNLRLTPQIRYVFQKPWVTTDERALEYENVYWDPTAQEFMANLNLNWEATDWLSWLAGSEYTYNWTEDTVNGFVDPQDDSRLISSVAIYHFAAYLQGQAKTPYVNILAGARIDAHRYLDASIVPRIGLTKRFGPFHFKLLFNQDQRFPNVMNWSRSIDVAAEKATTYELEMGYQITKQLYLSVNGFDITIDKPIVYFFDEETNAEGYRNYPKIGTRGVEFTASYKTKALSLNLNYSFYDATGKNQVDSFSVPGHQQVLLGFAPHKLAFNGTVELASDLSLHLSCLFLSNQRYGYATLDAEGYPALKDLGPEFLINVYLLYRNLGIKGLYAGLGVYNLLNAQQVYIQPYNNWHAPLPGPSTEVMIKLGYELPFADAEPSRVKVANDEILMGNYIE